MFSVVLRQETLQLDRLADRFLPTDVELVTLSGPAQVGHFADGGRMSLFTKIIQKEVPATIVYEDEHCLAFRDIRPQAPTHILLIPKKEIPTLNDVGPDDQMRLGHLLLVAPKIAAQEGIDKSGYRLVMNTNSDAGQTVFHIHLHILGGRPMDWPPG